MACLTFDKKSEQVNHSMQLRNSAFTL